jgi:polyferredoxin
MDQVKKPRGLIRYDSENGIAIGQKLKITTRMIGYSLVLVALVTGLGFGIGSRSSSEVTILRAPGQLFQEVGTDSISNLYNFKIVNKSRGELPVSIVIENLPASIKSIGSGINNITLKRDGLAEGTFFVIIHRKDLEGRKNKLEFKVLSGDKELETYSSTFLAPVK